MNEGKKDGEDGEEAEQQQQRLQRFQKKKKRGNPKTHPGEERYTQRRETTTERSEQMHKKCIRDKRLTRTKRHPRDCQCLCVNSTKKLFEDNEQDESEREIRENGNESSTDVHINDTDEMMKSCKLQSINSKKVNPKTATGSEPKTLKHVMTKREKW